MTIILLLLITAAVVGALRMATLDKRPRWNPPASHHANPGSRPPSEWLSRL